LLQECLRIREERLPEDYWRFHAMSLLGEALLAQGRLAEAEPLLRGGAEKLATSKAPVRLQREAFDRITRLFEQRKRPDLADPWRKKQSDLELAE